MASRRVPAHTLYTCDRCGKESSAGDDPEGAAWRGESASIYTVQLPGADPNVELCGGCYATFKAWLKELKGAVTR